MKPVLCFGELLLRFSPALNGTWIRESAMPVYVGGAELNVARALARWGVPVSYASAAPDHYLTAEILQFLQGEGVDTAPVHRSGKRIGTYYLPQGADLKNAGVIYDRAHSSFWELKPGMLDWDAVLEGKDWFHFSAITPALNAGLAAVCREGAAAARSKGLFVSVDLNYRAKLWQYGKAPDAVMPELTAFCDLVMGNIWAAEKMLGIALPQGFEPNKEASLEQAARTSEAIRKGFPQCRAVANTFRFEEPEGLRYYATLFRDGALSVSGEHRTSTVVDKVGSGDCFMAGLVYGYRQEWGAQAVIDFAAAAAFRKLFIRGDATTASVEEIKNHMLHVY
ncbi:MAG TPA: sugar kinase [Chitinophagaceae bacterium]|jgi:2-dehydro-3-deoxygluconokinase|nr:sugar kinase [Chitinophagaceae bacterium]